MSEEQKSAAEKAAQQPELTLEEAFAQLDALAERLEERDIPLEQAFEVYRQGMELLKQCSEKIDTVEKQMLQVNEDGILTEFA